MSTLMKIDDGVGVSRRVAVAARLREEFARLNISISAAARHVDMTQPKLSRRMNAEVPFDVDLLDRVCAITGADYDYVATGIREVPFRRWPLGRPANTHVIASGPTYKPVGQSSLGAVAA